LLAGGGCRAAEKKQDVPVVRMATILGRIMNPLSASLSKVLPERFPARLEVKNIADSGEYPRMLENGEIELAMIQTNLAYAAYTQGLGDWPKPMRRLRGVAVLYTTPLHLLATRESHIKSIMDVRGKRISLGGEGGPTEYTAKMALMAVGISFNDIQIRRISDSNLVKSLRDGDVDGVFYRGNDPYPLIQEMMEVPGVSFISMSKQQIETIRAHHPFLHAMSIPAGIYKDNPEVETVGGDMLLACRADLADELVYWVTRTLFESLPDLANSLPSLRQVDPEHVQASPVPLHPGAARFYRERELFP